MKELRRCSHREIGSLRRERAVESIDEYNNEGKGLRERDKYSVGHPGGALAFFNHIAAWRSSGEFKGLVFT